MITDLDGNFSLEIPNGAVIEISYIGYATQEITASGQTGLQVKLTEDTQKIDEVVVTALGINAKAARWVTPRRKWVARTLRWPVTRT